MAKLLGHKTTRLPNGGKIKWDDRQLQVAINKNMGRRLKEDAELVANYARDEVPVGGMRRAASQFKSWAGRKPGSLLKSIKVVKSKYKDGGWLVKVGGYDTYYWFFVEYGTSKWAGHPFMRTALKKARHRIKSKYGRT